MKIVMSLFLAIILVVGVLSSMFTIHPVKAGTIIVPDDYSTIQEAINHSNEGDTVFVKNGTYNEHITISKPLNLEGEKRNTTIIDGGYSEPASIVVVAADNVKMSGFTIQHCRSGGNAIWIDSYVNMTFSYNIITGCNEGVRIFNSSGDVVSDNIVQDCYYNTGVGIDYGFNNTVYRNTIIHNHYGISGGIDCHGNTFSENTIINNDIGFGTTSYDSKFFHNNFVSNGVHVIASGINQFDDGYPSGGNYWSDYAGSDLLSGPNQNETRKDGIGDSPYVIDANNMDRYPLVTPFGQQTTLYVPTRYQTIQEAINAANPRDTIFVFSGTYYEHVVVNKTVSLVGENREKTIIDGNRTAPTVVMITSTSYVNISHFTIRNGVLSDGYVSAGVSIEQSNHVSVKSCRIVNNTDGIYLGHSWSSVLESNCILNNSQSGICLDSSASNRIVANIIMLNRNSYVYTAGIYLSSSDGNIVENNTVANNSRGISLHGVVDSLFIHNNILSNQIQAQVYTESQARWDNGFEGNYWSDHNSTDSDHDGIGDTPYIIDSNNIDHYPLMNPYWIPADVNHDLKINIFDVVRITGAYGATPASPYWNPHADIAQPFDKIDIFDIVLCTSHYGEKYP